MKMLATITCLFALSVLPSAICAQVPALINYQGRLTDGTNLVNDTVEIIFNIYDQETAGTLQYADTQTVVVVDGCFTAQIGSSNNTAGALMNALQNPQAYLGIEVDGTAMTPRERLVAVPYSLGVHIDAVGPAHLDAGIIRGVVECDYDHNSVSGAIVYVQGKSAVSYAGPAVAGQAPYELFLVPSGTHTVVVRRVDGSEYETQVTLAAGEVIDPLNLSFLETYYQDADGDGFGDPANPIQSCGQPPNYVANDFDNCPSISNPGQEDIDGDGVGDACDPPECGNGYIEAGEECDDGNYEDGDGCDSNCYDELCGNGIVGYDQFGVLEECDDGNQTNGDGCDDDPANGGDCTPTE